MKTPTDNKTSDLFGVPTDAEVHAARVHDGSKWIPRIMALLVSEDARLTASQHCKRVGVRSVKQMAAFHGVHQCTVCYWKRERPETFDRKLAEVAVALRRRSV